MSDGQPRRLVLWGVGTGRTVRAHWALHNQPRDGWTHELDIRPYSERW